MKLHVGGNDVVTVMSGDKTKETSVLTYSRTYDLILLVCKHVVTLPSIHCKITLFFNIMIIKRYEAILLKKGNALETQDSMCMCQMSFDRLSPDYTPKSLCAYITSYCINKTQYTELGNTPK